MSSALVLGPGLLSRSPNLVTLPGPSSGETSGGPGPAVALGVWSVGGGTCPVRGEVKPKPSSAVPEAWPS